MEELNDPSSSVHVCVHPGILCLLSISLVQGVVLGTRESHNEGST